MILSWLKAPNLYAMAALVFIGGAIVVGLFQAGVRHERRKVEAETAQLNTQLAQLKARDRVELEAEAKAAAATDATVAASLTQKCIITDATARLLAEVR